MSHDTTTRAGGRSIEEIRRRKRYLTRQLYLIMPVVKKYEETRARAMRMNADRLAEEMCPSPRRVRKVAQYWGSSLRQ